MVVVTCGSTCAHEVYWGDGGQEERFQAASLSKQFTAATALLLVEDGTLSLADRPADRLPGSPAAWSGITLHHLLSHTSGLPHWDALSEPIGPGAPPSRSDTVAQVMRMLPLAAPGRRWHYSSPGYVLVALLIEQTTGRAYADILRERILDPLGLAHTGAAQGLVSTTSGVTDPGCLPGAGDLWSTARDLAHWARVLERGGLLRPASLRRMYTSHATPHAPGFAPLTATGYGYGVFLGALAEHRARFHHGDNPGYRSLLVRLPERDTTVVILTRGDGGDLSAILAELFTTPGL
ncbi:serine hydrolase domain-containing protein [Streptomyces sp. NPDC057638]|uniref:serine hydrolase domain-containing protein n=1 Tax=Streptomyces sp. NPDC057638 TaxID=3346190 RepID=UPI00368F09E8